MTTSQIPAALYLLVLLFVTASSAHSEDAAKLGLPPAEAEAADDRFTQAEFRETVDMLHAMDSGSGKFAEVERLARQLHAFAKSDFGPDSRQTLEVEFLVTRAIHRQGRYDQSRGMAQAVAQRAHQLLSPDDDLLWHAMILLIEAMTLSGDLGQALSFGGQMLLEAERRLTPDHRFALEIRAGLGRAALFDGEIDAAERHFAHVVNATETIEDNARLAVRGVALSEWARMLWFHGRFEEALPRLTGAEKTFQNLYGELRNGDVHPDVVLVTTYQARALSALGRGDEVPRLVAPMMKRVAEVYGDDSTRWAGLAEELAIVTFGNGDDPDEAARAVDTMMKVEAIRAGALSATDIDLIGTRDVLGFMLARRGRVSEALDMFDRTLDAGGTPRGEYYMQVLAQAGDEGAVPPRQAAGAALDYLQSIQSDGAARAQAQLNARLAAGAGAAGVLLRELSDAQAQVDTLRQQLTEALARPLDQRDRDAEARMRTVLGDAESEVRATQERMRADNPNLASVSGNDPLSLADIQSRLGTDEAVVILETGALGAEPLGLVLTRENGYWFSIDATPMQISEAVDAIRASLRLELRLRAAVPMQRDARRNEAFPFDRAHWLYQTLLAPGEHLLADKSHVYFDLRGPVTALPPQLLLTAAPSTDVPGDAPWLIRRHAITVLPSLSALRTAELVQPSPSRQPILAFADPVFETITESAPTGLRGALAPLPETADEVRAVTAMLGQSAEAARLGPAASEAALKAAALDRYRVLYFATHGLVAGDIAASDGAPLSEPALALTAGGGEDGLLSASEIAQLRLAADWVVLSACNTAVGNAPGAEPLSGLVQSFLYAGARALLVSHWPVESHSAVQLMTDLFRVRTQQPELSAAEAQRQAILSMIDASTDPRWSHPAYWGPFILVGDPG